MSPVLGLSTGVLSRRGSFRGLRRDGRSALIRANLAPTRRAGWRVLNVGSMLSQRPRARVKLPGSPVTQALPFPFFSKFFYFQCDIGCLLPQFNVFRLQHL